MPVKATLIICLGVVLAPWVSAVPASGQTTTDETLTLSTVVTMPGSQVLRSFDISYVDSTVSTYVLAASATPSLGNDTATGPASRPRIIVVDTVSNNVVHEYNANPTFAGSCSVPPARDDFSGPNGVMLIEGTSTGKGDIWVADGPIYSPSCAYPGCTLNIPQCPGGGMLDTPSSVRVIERKTGNTKATIYTDGKARSDELCYNPNSNVVLVANDATIDNFITFINEDNYGILQTINFNGSDPNSGPFAHGLKANGIEQCVFDPNNGDFYLNIPAVVPVAPSTNAQGYVLRISATAPFHVKAAFQIPASTGCTGGSGLAVGPSHQLFLGCGGTSTNSLIISDQFNVTFPIGPHGPDEVWFNPGANHYYGAASTPGLLGVVDAGPPPTADSNVTTASGSHSVAADQTQNQVYVPIRSNIFSKGTTICSSVTGDPGDDVQGCIAVYNDPGDVTTN